MSNKNYHNDDVDHSSSPTMKNKFAMTRSTIISLLAAVGLVIVVAVHHHSSSPPTSTSKWPTVLYSSFLSSNNGYKGTGELGYGSVYSGTTGRPITTKEAASNGWKPLQKECVPNLGYPWAFDGKITDGAPVTLYYSKETKKNVGVLTGMAVHYYDDVAPDTMIGSEFLKGEDYDTLQVAFHDKNTDVCGVGPLFSNEPYIALLLVDGNGRKHIPMTEDAAKASGEWAKGSCLKDMGIHWWNDIENGSNLSFEAKYLFPIAPMYNATTGSLHGIMFVAAKFMQNWDIKSCGVNPFSKESLNCRKKTNLWDVNPMGLLEKKAGPFYMCDNFCGDTCEDKLTGAAGSPPSYSTMHWFFVNKEDIGTCGPRCGEIES